MLRVIAALIAGLLLCAQTPMLPGFPPGTFQNRAALDATSGSSYQGPGDVKTFVAWGSCARAYNATYAASLGNLCDLVDSAAPSTVICTLKSLSTGFVNLASASCTGSVTPAVKCAAATGGVCNVSQVYDQTGNSNHFTQATGGSQPTLTFSAINSLPGITTTPNQFVASPAITQSQPFSMSAVYERTDGLSQGGVIGADSGATICSGGLSANQTYITAGTNQAITAADNAFHSINNLFNNTSSIINLNGSESATLSPSTGAFSSNAIRIGRCDAATLGGIIMEAGIIGGTTNATERGNLSTNQHGANGYNF